MRKLTHIFLLITAFASSCLHASDEGVGNESISPEVAVGGISFCKQLSAYADSSGSSKGLVIENNFVQGAAFGVLAYDLADGYWDSTLNSPVSGEVPGLMYNQKVELEDVNTDNWIYSPVVSWPEDTKIKFFAYYPYGDDMVVSLKDTAGYPVLSVPTINSDPAQQIDFMIAQTETLDNSISSKVSIDFEHVLSQIDFLINYQSVDDAGVAQNTLNWQVKPYSVTLSGVKNYSGIGQFSENGFAWSYDDGSAASSSTYRLTVSGGHLSSVDVPIASGSNHVKITTSTGVLLLLPQLIADGQVTVTFAVEIDKDDGEGFKVYTLVVNAKAHEYVIGRRIVYQYTVNPYGLVGDDEEGVGSDLDVDVDEWEDFESSDNEFGTVLGEDDLDLDQDEWANGNGNSNDFSDDGLTGENVDDLETPDNENWEGDSESTDNELGSPLGEAELDDEIDTNDEWVDGNGNSNDFGDDDLNDESVDGLETPNQDEDDNEGWEGDEESTDNQLGSTLEDLDTDGEIDVNDEWVDGNGNSNDFGDDDLNDESVDGLETPNQDEDDNEGWEGNTDSSDNNLSSDLVDGDSADVDSDSHWSDGNGNSNDFGDGQSDSTPEVDGDNWVDGNGSSNDFDDNQAESNSDVDNPSNDNWEGPGESSDNSLSGANGESDTSGSEAGDWNGENGNSNDFGGGSVDESTDGGVVTDPDNWGGSDESEGNNNNIG